MTPNQYQKLLPYWQIPKCITILEIKMEEALKSTMKRCVVSSFVHHDWVNMLRGKNWPISYNSSHCLCSFMTFLCLFFFTDHSEWFLISCLCLLADMDFPEAAQSTALWQTCLIGRLQVMFIFALSSCVVSDIRRYIIKQQRSNSELTWGGSEGARVSSDVIQNKSISSSLFLEKSLTVYFPHIL